MLDLLYLYSIPLMLIVLPFLDYCKIVSDCWVWENFGFDCRWIFLIILCLKIFLLLKVRLYDAVDYSFYTSKTSLKTWARKILGLTCIAGSMEMWIVFERLSFNVCVTTERCEEFLVMLLFRCSEESIAVSECNSHIEGRTCIFVFSLWHLSLCV